MADYTIQNGCLTLRVASRGAEMQSLLDAKGRERLWQGDPEYWTGRAPVLFPFAGGLKNGCFLHGGRRYEMEKKHGFARASEFVCEEATGDKLTFLLDAAVPAYPFRYEFRAIYALEGESVRVTYDTLNTGDQTLYFAVGAHEAYAIDGDISRYTLIFDEEEDMRACLFDGALLTRDSVKLTEDRRRLTLTDDQIARLETVMIKDVRSRGVTLASDLNDKTVRVEFPGFDYLLLWKKPGARYFCIEPWVNPPEYVDGSQLLSEKTGMIALAPGEARAFTHTITVK